MKVGNEAEERKLRDSVEGWCAIMFKRFAEELAEFQAFRESPHATILGRAGHRMTSLFLL